MLASLPHPSFLLDIKNYLVPYAFTVCSTWHTEDLSLVQPVTYYYNTNK